MLPIVRLGVSEHLWMKAVMIALFGWFTVAAPAEPQSALELFDDAPSLEKSLTEYLTGHAANGTAE